MNHVQRPRDERDSPELPPQGLPPESMPRREHAPRDMQDGQPEYGIRVPDGRPVRSTPGADAVATPAGTGRLGDGPREDGPRAEGTAAASTGGGGSGPQRTRQEPDGGTVPQERAAAARAARRMGRGLSFTVIMLGLLVGLGLVSMGLWFGWVVGAVLVVLGVLGYAVVQTRALPVFRSPHEPARGSWSKLWLIPAALLVPGLVCFAVAFVVPSWLGPTVPADLLDDYVLAFVVGGMTMVVGAGLGFGLVATARFTRPDDDDSPLRPTDYAERLREREREDGGDYYDSDWIRRDPRP